MLSSFFQGIYVYADAWSMLSRKENLKYVLISALITFGLALLMFLGSVQYILQIKEDIVGVFSGENSWTALWKIVPLVVGLLLLTLLFRTLVLLLNGPFLAKLSASADAELTGFRRNEEGWKQFTRDMIRALRFSVWCVTWEILLTLLFLLLQFVPVIGTIMGSVGIFLVQAFFAAAGYLDFSLERRGFSLKDSLTEVKRYKGALAGLGAANLAFLLIPVLGLLVAPALTTLASTLWYVKQKETTPQ